MTEDDGDMREKLGELTGVVRAGFEASKERYQEMREQIGALRGDVKELDDCLDKGNYLVDVPRPIM